MTFTEFSTLYCERQQQTPDGLKEVLKKQVERYSPDGWMLLECQMMDSSSIGNLTILPFGPNNTFKTIPDHPISPRGLCSDMSVVIATLKPAEL